MVIRYNNLELNMGEKLDLNWSRSGLLQKSKLHSVASYLAMFAPALPEYFIKRYSQEGDIVMDPFSGRGTTALRARETNRNFVGFDLNPYALVLSRLKCSIIDKNILKESINNLEMLYFEWVIENKNIHQRKEFKELSIYYSPSTLNSLIFLRSTLGCKWRENDKYDNAILAFTLGIMHGPMRKNGKSSFLSLSMSNSISMSPNYVHNFAKKNNLKKPIGSFFNKLRDRIDVKFETILNNDFNGNVYEWNATINNVQIEDESVSLVVTSPPYLNIVNYTNSNWIKLWLLGYDRQTLKFDIQLSDNLKYEEYIIFITNVLISLENKIIQGGHVCLIVGDVEERKLIEEVWHKISNTVNFEFVEIFYDHGYTQNKKILNTMNTRAGKATMIEKVLVLRKV